MLMKSEESMLLSSEPIDNELELCSPQSTELLKKISITTLSLFVALPTSILNGLAATVGANGNLDNLNSLEAIKELLTSQPIESILFGALCFLASQGVLTGLNKKYLLGSAANVINLIKNNFNLIKSLIMSVEIMEKPSLIENGLFIWCFFTSLIFAELGKQTLSFLKTPGELIGFYLNLIVYFATRFSGARSLFQTFIEQNEGSSDTTVSSESFFMKKIIPISGYLLATFCVIPVLLNFIPESIQGLESLCHYNISAGSGYHNAASFGLGLFGSLPTAFFYGLAIKDVPKHIAKAVSLVYAGAKDQELTYVLKLLSLTFLAIMVSTFTSMGFRLVGSSNLENGYLSYLSEPIEHLMPVMLFVSCILMFWSHLQHLINESFVSPVEEGRPNVSSSPSSFFAIKNVPNISINTDEEDSEIIPIEVPKGLVS